MSYVRTSAKLEAAVNALQAGQPVGPAEELLDRRETEPRGLRREIARACASARGVRWSTVVASACESFIGDGSSQTRPIAARDTRATVA